MKRFNVLVCHRRFGKTFAAIGDMIDRGFRNPLKKPQYAYIAPTYAQAKKIAWDILKDFLYDFKDIKVYERELRIDVKRGEKDWVRFMLLSAENPDSLRGLYLDGAILDEFADQPEQIWATVVRPALSDRKGWATFISTPKGRNAFYRLHKRAKDMMKEDKDSQWYTHIFKLSETKILDKREVEDLKRDMTPEEFAQEYECDFNIALANSYYKTEFEGLHARKQIAPFSHEVGLTVNTAWDLGMDDSTAIWFYQTVGKEVRIIDYYETSGKGFPEIVKELRQKPYDYENATLPHDAAVREFSGMSRVETLERLNLFTNVTVLQRTGLEDGINAVRLFLPKCWFNEDKCDIGIDYLKGYQREYDTKTQTYKNHPLHDFCSHAADAFRTLVLGYNLQQRRLKRVDMVESLETEYDMWGM